MSYHLFHPGVEDGARVEVRAALESVQLSVKVSARRPKDEPRALREPCGRIEPFEPYYREQVRLALLAAGQTGD